MHPPETKTGINQTYNPLSAENRSRNMKEFIRKENAPVIPPTTT